MSAMFATLKIILAPHKNVLCRKSFHLSHLIRQKCSKSSTLKGPPWNILFFGTDHFSLQSLKALCSKLRTGTLISSLEVVTKKNSIVCKLSKEEKLPCHYWPINRGALQSSHIGVVVSFGNLITKEIIQSLPLGCINVHASILPRWRGAAPIIHAILAGDNETGITIMRIHPHKFDIGEIVRQYRISISGNETTVDLEKRLAQHGSNLLMECIRDLPKCLQMAVPQPQSGVTYAPKVDPSLSIIDWKNLSAQSLFNKHRALSHLYPLKASWHGQTVKFRSICIDPESQKRQKQSNLEANDSHKSALKFLNSSSEKVEHSCLILNSVDSSGQCFYDKARKLLKIKCADGQNIIVNKLQIGNKVMSSSDFFNGFMTKQNNKDWYFSKLICE